MFHLPNGPELIVVLALALIVFGPKKLPEIGKSIGQGLRELRKASREITDAFQGAANLDLDDDPTPPSVSGPQTTDPVPDNRPEADMHVETPKENEQDDANSVGPDRAGVVDNRSSDSSALRSEETA